VSAFEEREREHDGSVRASDESLLLLLCESENVSVRTRAGERERESSLLLLGGECDDERVSESMIMIV
jgi:hypothetical protein